MNSPQLCLIVETTPEAGARLIQAFAGAAATALIVAPAPGARLDGRIAAELVTAAQDRKIAALLEDDTGLAKAISADGVHLTPREDLEDAYAAARRDLGPDAIIGVDTGGSRHDAMSLGERGADYVAFAIPEGFPDPADAAAEQSELVQWWAEIFEIPVLALDVETREEAGRLTAAGADFIAARIPAGLALDEISAWASDFAHALEANRQTS